MILLLTFIFFTNYVSTEAGEPGSSFKGVKYVNGRMHAVMEKEDLDAEFKVKHIGIENGLFHLEGTAVNNESEYELAIEGEIYRSNIQLLLDDGVNPYVSVPKSNTNESIEVLSITLEEKAYKGLLLPANYDLEGKNIIKMALKVGSDLLYFEDETEGISFSELANHSETVERSDIEAATNEDDKKQLEEKYEQIDRSEGWFFPYLDFNHNNVTKEPRN
ncbi:hypothetical protein [Oceanobacillus kapialis]|uniref:hypothetical protein n=1 Tax=Oceanobacillus kapialis TaxID=481353 RepID=UPI00384BD51A